MIVVGGMVRRADGGIVGETAVDFIRQFKVDYAVIGVSAIDDDGPFSISTIARCAPPRRSSLTPGGNPRLRLDEVHPLGAGAYRPYQ